MEVRYDKKNKMYEVEMYGSCKDFEKDVYEIFDAGYYGEFNGITISCHYNLAKRLINDFIKSGKYELFDCDIAPEDSNGYEDMYTITLTDDNLLFCEKSYKPSIDGYIILDDETMNNFVWYDSTMTAAYTGKRDIIPFVISDYIGYDDYTLDDYADNDIMCDISTYRDHNGDICGIEAKWDGGTGENHTSYSLKTLSRDVDYLHKIAKILGLDI